MIRLHRYILKVSTDLSDAKCKDAGMKLLDLIWVNTQVCGPRSQKHSSEIVCQGIQDQEARQHLKRLICCSVVLCEAAKVRVSIMTSVGWSSQGFPVEVETPPHQQKAFPRNSPETHIWILLSNIDRKMVRTKLTDSSSACTQIKMLLTSGNLTM